jgi:very-short-patch-repair endonuclease
MTRQSAHDRRISDVAARQHGVAARRQLLDAGVPDHIIDERVRTRRLLVVRRGVYAVGHDQLRREGEWLAAVLALGPGAVLSHRTAAVHWGLEDGPALPIHVLAPNRSGRKRRRGIVAHTGALPPDERAELARIPITSVARTILDAAAGSRTRALEQVVRRASRQRLFDLGEQRTVMERHPRHRGAPVLARLLAELEGKGTAEMRSRMEIAFAELCDDFSVPRPVANRIVEGERVDFSWPGTTLIVETDGFEFHSMPTTFANDRARDQKLTLAGYTVVRLTYRQVTSDRAATVALVGTMLMLQRCRAA